MLLADPHGHVLEALDALFDRWVSREESGDTATADSAILDACDEWVNLARIMVEQHRSEVEPMWLLDLS